MKLPKIGKNQILLIALAVVGVVAYFMLSGGSDPALTTSESGVTGTIGQELVVELNRLKSLQNIRLDVLKDPAFVSLQDYTQYVVPQPLGRPNPLAPIGQ
jgi:hypothetical protein